MKHRIPYLFTLLIYISISTTYLSAQIKEELRPILFYNINIDFKTSQPKKLILQDNHKSLIKFIDINNDNLPDLLTYYTHGDNNYTISVQYNNTNGFDKKHVLWEKHYEKNLLDGLKTYFIDINHDKLKDIIQVSSGKYGHHTYVKINNGTGYNKEEIWFDDNDSRLQYFKITFIDMDNDGLRDMLQVYRYNSGHRIYVRHNTGTSFAKKETWLDDNQFKYLSNSWSIDILDINNDGFPDIIQKSISSDGHKLYVRLNNGQKLEEAKLWYSNSRADYNFWDIKIMDMNHDKLPDIVQVYDHYEGQRVSVSYNDGTKFKKPKILLYDNDIKYTSKTWSLRFIDIDNDGLIDITNIHIDKGGQTVFRRSNHGKTFGTEKLWFSDIRTDLDHWNIDFIDLNNDGYQDIIQTPQNTIRQIIPSSF